MEWPLPTKTNSITQTFGIYQLRDEDSLKAQLALITRKLDALEAKEIIAVKPIARMDVQAYSSCGGMDVMAQECLVYVREVERNALGMSNRSYHP